jgi:hypothetical protein
VGQVSNLPIDANPGEYHCRNGATDAKAIAHVVLNSSGVRRPKFRQRFQLLVPAYTW